MKTEQISKKKNIPDRTKKEKLLSQHGTVIWFTGLSGSGKSTLASALENELYKNGFISQVLDGDILRKGLNKDLGFSENDRMENIRRVSEVAGLFCKCGIITIAAFISPTKAIRNIARTIINSENLFEIFLNTPFEICEKRDPKGLYAKARAGIVKEFTGISSPYEPPVAPNLIIDTSQYSIEECVEMIYQNIIPLINKKS